jgi:hypothetical protein
MGVTGNVDDFIGAGGVGWRLGLPLERRLGRNESNAHCGAMVRALVGAETGALVDGGANGRLYEQSPHCQPCFT